MSFLDKAFDVVGGAFKTAVNVGEEIVGDVAKVGIGTVEAGIDTVGDIVKNPAELLNPFAVISGAGRHLIGDVAAEFTRNTSNTAASEGTSTGGSVYDKLFALLGQLEDKLNKQVDDASKIDPTKQGDIQKAMFQIQQTQNLMTQIVTTATNLLKKTDETVSTINQNLR